MLGRAGREDSVVDVDGTMDVSSVVVVSDVRDASDVVVESDVLVSDDVDVSNASDVLDVVVDSLALLSVPVVLDSMVLDDLVSTGCSVSDALVWLSGSSDGVDDSVVRVVWTAVTSDDHGVVNGSGSSVEVGIRGGSHELGAGPSISV
ncbi:hypothetical protein N7510_008728 [Penicillium lagena]|uniref:uncharacterized protein n=1 Tax=Penicillium lagena TaxID=94218 RepID=UPI00254246ED|nr:uncharacterized protein N7510_008728 [Penicillium lagena]KAJ5605947.1 hypothetical protein N7510_008728 [Penicillium lagena]